MHIIYTGATWPVGVHWDVLQPLLNEKRAVAHTDAACGVAPELMLMQQRSAERQKQKQLPAKSWAAENHAANAASRATQLRRLAVRGEQGD